MMFYVPTAWAWQGLCVRSTACAPAILQPPDQLRMAQERQDLQKAMTCLPVTVRSVSSPT